MPDKSKEAETHPVATIWAQDIWSGVVSREVSFLHRHENAPVRLAH
jgi:hypothetical protein